MKVQLAWAFAERGERDTALARITALEAELARAKPQPNKVSIYYMHSNCTFSPLTGTVKEIIEAAKQWATKSSYGMLTSAVVLIGDKEVRRVGVPVHAKQELGDTAEWERAVRNDPDIMRLLDAARQPEGKQS